MTTRLFNVCGLKARRLAIVSTILGLSILGYCLNIWTVSLKTRNLNISKRLHIMSKLNWSVAGNTQEVQHVRENLFNQLSASMPLKDRIGRQFPANETQDSVDDEAAIKSDHLGLNDTGTLTIQLAQNYTAKVTSHYNSVDNHNFISTDMLVKDFLPNIHVEEIDCSQVILGNTTEISKAKLYQSKHHKKPMIPLYYTLKAKDCKSFIANRHYTMHPLSKEEEEFPIAYSLVVYTDMEQVERLLRAIYRPQNYYCVHVDGKASTEFREAMTAIVNCFDNVLMASRSVDIQWGWYSVLEPEIVCMEDLWKYRKWKYFINLTGQEFPLKTNGDIVKILKTMDGANNVHGTVKRRNRDRVEYVHKGIYTDRKVKKPPPPVPVTLTKGSLHIVVQRGYVDYILHNEQALEFRNWVNDTGVPDETFFTSLNYSPQLNVPGSYKGEPETDHIDQEKPRNPFFARFKNWGDSIFNWTCHGQRVRMICVFGVGDLPLLSTRKELFANKFHQTYHPLAYNCLEELHYNRTRDSVLGKRDFDASFYANLDIVKNHVT